MEYLWAMYLQVSVGEGERVGTGEGVEEGEGVEDTLIVGDGVTSKEPCGGVEKT